ncbi:hypothetical protein ACEPAI_4224 [Sanghuangporus weigelae]
MDSSELSRKLTSFARWLRSRRAVSVYKGATAYVIGFILIFLRSFDDLSAFPLTFTSMTILLIVGGAGMSFGTCVQSTALALIGVGAGAVGFFILAKLVESQIAQGFVFAALVYGFALVKAQGLKWFPLALLAILMSFNGIYTSLLVGRFDSAYLEEYLKTYFWAAAIVLTVNILILPISSEKEMRQTLILSLEHVSTFLHLLAKTYTMEITEEERAVRDHLAQSIRADFGLLSNKIDETFIEINYSRFSTKEYQSFVTRVRRMQQSLIAVYSSLINVEKKDTDLFRTEFLPNTVKSFNKLRGALNATMREIIGALGCQRFIIPASSAGYAEFMDVERQESSTSLRLRREPTRASSARDTVDERLDYVARRLAEELNDNEIDVDGSVDASHNDQDIEGEEQGTNVQPRSAVGDGLLDVHANQDVGLSRSGSQSRTYPTSDREKEHEMTSARKTSSDACVRSLRRIFDNFCTVQHDIMVRCLSDGQLHGGDDTLRLLEPLPSLKATYQYRYVPSASGPELTTSSSRPRRRRRSWMDDVLDDGPATPPATPYEKQGDIYYEMAREKTKCDHTSDEITAASHHSLMRVYSFLFTTEQLVSEVETLYHTCKALSTPRLRIHYFPRINRPDNGFLYNVNNLPTKRKETSFSLREERTDDPESASFRELSVAEAVALLEHRTYTRPGPSIFQRIYAAEQWLRGPSSVYAAKTAAATTIFAVLILHPVPRQWFISFGMVGGALTIVTALQPTLGQSVFSFILQILGSGVGYIWALILLEIFDNVGGFHFNPYGIVALLIPFALALFYILYNKPQFFVAGILGLNGAGTVLITEWINVEYLGNSRFDSPVLRFGKAFSTLGVALGLVAVFQLFVLRNPARRTLRKRVGTMLFSQLSYLTLLQAFVRGVMPTDPSRRAPDAAISRVIQELRHRELKLQAELISLRPLVNFAANEAQYQQPFRDDIVNKILRNSQIMLDRMRESRIAISYEPLPDVVLRNYVQVLAPYRRRNSQILQLGYYLVASSILAKAPLLREIPAELESAGEAANFMHDMLVLAGRHARTPEGARTIRSGSFTRYFHYLVSITSLSEHLKALEDACKDLFGELEDHLT